ncbi:MAG: hypothetical protein QM610_04980 [Chitinophagaceae bacterium]
MTKYCFLIIGSLIMAHGMTSAQSKKEKKAKAEQEAQLANFRSGYKRMFIDSLGLTPPIADTAAAIETEAAKKLSDLARNKKIEQDEKDFQTGMIGEQKDNRLKLVMPQEAFEKYTAMQKRWKAEREAREKEAKDAQNSQPMDRSSRGGRGGYGGGYGRY